MADPSQLRLTDSSGTDIPLQTKILSRWTDDSAKWVLFDFSVSIAPKTTQVYTVSIDNPTKKDSSLIAQITPAHYKINLKNRSFLIDRKKFAPPMILSSDDTTVTDQNLSQLVLIDSTDTKYLPIIDHSHLEEDGCLKTSLRFFGSFVSGTEKSFLKFVATLTFYRDSALIKMDFTLHNDSPAQHESNLWDLGDKNSVLFRDLSLQIALCENSMQNRWSCDDSSGVSDEIEIYQDSSGGDNWNSPNHINREGKQVVSFKGYRITTGTTVKTGDRINPIVSLKNNNTVLSVAIKDFWQNFPKSIKTHKNTLKIGLFPDNSNDLFELQGGEQKTHTIYFSLDDNPDYLRFIFNPLIPKTTPDWYYKTGVFDDITSPTPPIDQTKDKIVNNAITGENSFFDRREIIDEYGWRNFGEIYADHESVGQDKPFISHYNNQYDVIYAAIKRFLLTGDERWYRLFDDLAKHVCDIDIYHTDQDIPDYNHGLFWHTDHYMDAKTCTHRTYSIKNKIAKNLSVYGGGPSPSHNYTTGLMVYYYLTGSPIAKDSFLELTCWTKSYLTADRKPLKKLKSTAKKIILRLKSLRTKESIDRPYQFNGPGRASGNTLNALLDAFLFSYNQEYLDTAEGLIRACISPDDLIEKRNLFNSEMRWMYLIFLQSLIKYTKIKRQIRQKDFFYDRCIKTILHYANWMADNEYPFLRKPELLEYPNETWGAQDMRKSNIFDYAAKLAPTKEEMDRFKERADFFYASSIKGVSSFETSNLTRPIVLLMMFGYVHKKD